MERYDNDDILNSPDWREDVITVNFTFRDGLTKAVSISIAGYPEEEKEDIRRQVLNKRKLLQSVFEHNSSGQITIRGLTVRADDLVSVEIR